MEKQNLEERVAIKFCARLGEIASETYAKIVKVHGNGALSRAQVFRWHKEFKEGRESVEDEARSERPVEVRTDANAQRVRALIREDRRLTVRMLASELGINRETVRQILADDMYTSARIHKHVLRSRRRGLFIDRNESLYNALKEKLRFKCSVAIEKQNENVTDGTNSNNLNTKENQYGKKRRNVNNNQETDKQQSNSNSKNDNAQLNPSRLNTASNKQAIVSKSSVQLGIDQLVSKKQSNLLGNKSKNAAKPVRIIGQQLSATNQSPPSKQLYPNLGAFRTATKSIRPFCYRSIEP